MRGIILRAQIIGREALEDGLNGAEMISPVTGVSHSVASLFTESTYVDPCAKNRSVSRERPFPYGGFNPLQVPFNERAGVASTCETKLTGDANTCTR